MSDANPLNGYASAESTFCYDTIKVLAKERGCSVRDLFALAPANDPFYCGTPADLAAGEWFAALWGRFQFPQGVHLRRIHYRIISDDEPVLMRDGTPYENTEECWDKLGVASKCARYLGLVPIDAFVDRRSPPPTIYLPCDGEDADIEIESGDAPAVFIPSTFPPLPTLTVGELPVRQRYHVEVWCEKSTVDDILAPLCRRRGANLVTGVGEMSITAVKQLMRRAEESNKPVRILYVSDFDPAGMSMPVAVARKAEFFIRREHPDIDLRLFPVALTADQVREYRLPRTPIKEKERRKAGFEERFGAGATELDALAELRPGELDRILDAEITRYVDADLRYRVAEVEDQIQAHLDAVAADVLASHKDAIDALRDEYKRIRAELEEWKKGATAVWQGITDDLEQAAPDISDYDMPEARDADERDDALFDSGRDYLEQVGVYKLFQGKAGAA